MTETETLREALLVAIAHCQNHNRDYDYRTPQPLLDEWTRLTQPSGIARIPLLDHGYVQFIEAWGSDERIVESARMSTGKGFKGWEPRHSEACSKQQALDVEVVGRPLGCITGCEPTPGDEKFLRFLYENNHMSPFEFGGMIIEVQAPITVFREWHRHRTQSYNEMSGRYSVLPDLYYTPSLERIRAGRQSAKNKQGSDETIQFTEDTAKLMQAAYTAEYQHARDLYEKLILDGVARELARLVLPVAQYSRMRAQATLRNWLAFLTLRMAPYAQFEIRQYANAVGTLIATCFPRTWELYITHADETAKVGHHKV